MTAKESGWKPVRRGNIYCSPACGGSCTFDAYQRARRSAKALLDTMESRGWQMDVWENLGWHYALRHPELDISLHASGEWLGSEQTFFLCGDTNVVGNIPHMKDPNKLVDVLKKRLRDQAMRFERALTKL